MANVRIFFVRGKRLLPLRWICKYHFKGIKTVGYAEKTRKALPRIRKKKPDVVICDAVLNGRKDGIDFCTELREESDVPIIMLTDLVGELFLSRVKPLKLNDLLLKPVSPEELLESIYRVLENPEKEADYSKFEL